MRQAKVSRPCRSIFGQRLGISPGDQQAHLLCCEPAPAIEPAQPKTQDITSSYGAFFPAFLATALGSGLAPSLRWVNGCLKPIVRYYVGFPTRGQLSFVMSPAASKS